MYFQIATFLLYLGVVSLGKMQNMGQFIYLHLFIFLLTFRKTLFEFIQSIQSIESMHINILNTK